MRNSKTIGKIEDLAEGEQIKAARFMGDTGYFVTYRNTDPLFAADLSDPKNPRIMSELNITGFSEYLHFYGEKSIAGNRLGNRSGYRQCDGDEMFYV